MHLIYIHHVTYSADSIINSNRSFVKSFVVLADKLAKGVVNVKEYQIISRSNTFFLYITEIK